MSLLKDFAKKIGEKEFVDVWFKWVGYAIIVATIIAAGKKSESLTLQGIGYVSGFAICFHAVLELVKFAEAYKDDHKNATINAISIMLLVILFSVLASSIFPVIESLIQ